MARFTLPRDLYHGKGSLEALKTFKGKKATLSSYIFHVKESTQWVPLRVMGSTAPHLKTACPLTATQPN